MQSIISLQNEQQTLALGRQLAAEFEPPLIIFLEGELGTGKTTLVRGILQALAWQGKVKSPTYTLVETYPLAAMTIYHCDLYRLQSAYELQEIGFEEYSQDERGIMLVEWPEMAQAILAAPDIRCVLSYQDAGRKLLLLSGTQRGSELLNKVMTKLP